MATRSGHLLSLGVTMGTTVVSWFFYHQTSIRHQSFANPLVLWMTALGTGIISGAFTAVARRIALTFFASTALGRLLANKEAAYDIAISGNDDKGYMGVMMFQLGGLWFRQSCPARLFHAICFDMPVAQPVRVD